MEMHLQIAQVQVFEGPEKTGQDQPHITRVPEMNVRY